MQAYDVMSRVRVNNQVKEGLQEWSGGKQQQQKRKKSKKLQITSVSQQKQIMQRRWKKKT